MDTAERSMPNNEVNRANVIAMRYISKILHKATRLRVEDGRFIRPATER